MMSVCDGADGTGDGGRRGEDAVGRETGADPDRRDPGPGRAGPGPGSDAAAAARPGPRLVAAPVGAGGVDAEL